MPRLCCFLHPEYTQDENRELHDLCSECERPFGFPLSTAPEMIGQNRVVRPIGRGFYAAAYIVESPPFNRRRVLKLAFKSTYDFFKKDFASECATHAKIADGSQHIVAINDMRLDESVRF